ncbi:hypothetical protein [Pantoea ananatis]|uniref:hypothetical protein n=1 Tax=Pantoea ananas TaxID=553 RepID=UPI0023508508|nr:hypothetical protein [Pantoea ananatis]MDC7860791.1 hypothetical protein [Pantoea ananatis]
MENKKLIIASFLMMSFISSSAFADIDDISSTTNGTSQINVSLTVPTVCNIVGLDSTESMIIDPSSGEGSIKGIKSSCNLKSETPQISFESANSFELASADANNPNTIPYSVTFGAATVSANQGIIISETGEDLTMKVSTGVLASKTPDDYKDTLTATITL